MHLLIKFDFENIQKHVCKCYVSQTYQVAGMGMGKKLYPPVVGGRVTDKKKIMGAGDDLVVHVPIVMGAIPTFNTQFSIQKFTPFTF